ncbi:MAG: metal ABC transporter permease [Marinibacterium sp.]
MLDDFMTRAGLAGLGAALAAAPLGVFVVWRRMAFMGEATAHAGVLGVALALILELPMTLVIVVVAVVMARAVSALSGRGHSVDTLLGVAAHSALAAGLVALALQPGIRIDPMAFLVGDILAVGRADLALIWGGAAAIVGLIAWRWQALLTATLSPDLAYAAGIDPRREDLVLIVALALVVALAIKVVGALLISSLLIIPAAAARPLVRTPEAMALVAALIGAAAALGGLWGAYLFDTPTGPSIVCAAAVLFALTTTGRYLRGRIAAHSR